MDKFRFIIIPADICNLSCDFCCVAKCNGSSGTIMTTDDARAYAEVIMRYAIKHKLNYMDLQFFGGEPLLNLDAIKEFVNVVIEYHNKYNVLEMIDLCPLTNGMHNVYEFVSFINDVNKSISGNLFRIRTEIQFSFDGPKDLCDNSAQKTNIDPIKRAISTINKYADFDDIWQITIMVVISDHNARNMFNIFKWFHDNNILPYIRFRFDVENKNYRHLEEIALPELQKIITYINDNNLHNICENGREYFYRYSDNRPRGGCGAGIDTLCLSADGYLTGCQHDVVLISQRLPNRVYKKLTCVEDIENFTDLSFAEDWYQIGKDGHAEYEDICPSHYRKVKDDPDRKEFFRKVHEIVKQLDEGDKGEEEK